MKPKKKKCREKAPGCQGEYFPRSSFQKTCHNISCAIQRAERDRKAKKKKQACERARKDRIAREALKPRRKWIQEAQQAFNKYILARDYGKSCISCGVAFSETSFGSKFDAGHYRSIGSSHNNRFNLHNIHGQCVRCNRDLSGNTVEYRKGLIKRIGLEKVETLEANNERKNFDIEYLKRIKRIFNKKARMKKRRRDINNSTLVGEEFR